MRELWETFWQSVFDSFGQDPENHRRGCLRIAAWMLMLVALMLLTGGFLLIIPGPWVWIGAGGCGVLSAIAFWLSSRPEEAESED